MACRRAAAVGVPVRHFDISRCMQFQVRSTAASAGVFWTARGFGPGFTERLARDVLNSLVSLHYHWSPSRDFGSFAALYAPV